MSEPAIRRALVADAPQVSAIGRETFTNTFGHLYPPADLAHFLRTAYDEAKTEREIADPARAMWLVEAAGEAVGLAYAGPCDLPHPEVTPASGELKRFYLRPAWQNGGTGSRLFAEVMAWLLKDGPRDLWIGVWFENVGAQRFYARHGFEKVGEYAFEVGETRDREFILRRRP